MQQPRSPRKPSPGRKPMAGERKPPAGKSPTSRPSGGVASRPGPPQRPGLDAAPAKPAPKPRPKPGPRLPSKPGMSRVKVKEAPWVFDATRGAGKRFYQLDTLGNAIEGMLNRGDSWLGLVLRESLMGAKPDALTLELQWENAYSMTFRVGINTCKGQAANVLLVCAKNHQEHSKRLRGEIDALVQLAPRCPAGVLPIRAEGTIYLPAKNQAKGRQILACVRAWPGRCVPAEATATGQYILTGPERRLLSRAESESYGTAIALMLLQCFDALTRTGPSLNSLHETDVLCRHFRSGIAPALMHCPRVTRYRSIQAYVKGLLLWEPEPGSDIFPLQALSPQSLARALRAGLGDDLAPEAVRRLSAPGGEVSLPEATIAALRDAMFDVAPSVPPTPSPRERRSR